MEPSSKPVFGYPFLLKLTPRAEEMILADENWRGVRPFSQNRHVIICSTPTARGYIVVAPDGAVYAHGDAVYRGGANTGHLQPGDRVTGATYAADGSGYWLVAESGAVFAYGPPYLGGPNDMLP